MKCIILAAGRGSRMQGMTADRPKCLTILDGRTLLDWQTSALNSAGIHEIGVVRGYKAEMLSGESYSTFDNVRWAETNMVMSLMCAAKWLRNDVCLVSYADIVYRPDIVTSLKSVPAEIAITYDRDWRKLWSERFADPLSDAETFQSDAFGRLTEIGGKASDLDEIQGQYMGLLRFTPQGWSIVESYVRSLPPHDQDRLDMTTLLRRLLSRGVQIQTLAVDGGWCEVDSQSDLALYHSKLKSPGSWSHAWAKAVEVRI